MRPCSMFNVLPPSGSSSRTIISTPLLVSPTAFSSPDATPASSSRNAIPTTGRGPCLPPQPQFLHHLAITIDPLGLQVIEKPPTLSDQLQKATARVEILRVQFEMVG